MTNYNSQDMNGWEFKIVRSSTNRFRNPETLKRICAEEARSGWELMEKFDNQRLRFKRRIERRTNDQYATIDPYRTDVGMTEGQQVLIVLGIVAVAGALIALLALR